MGERGSLSRADTNQDSVTVSSGLQLDQVAPASENVLVRAQFRDQPATGGTTGGATGGSFSDRMRARLGTDLGPRGTPVPPPQPGLDTGGSRPVDTPPNRPNQTLELRYGDSNMDNLLRTSRYDTISVQAPAGIEVCHWVDQNGHFFWFKNRADGSNADGRRHYYNQQALRILINGQPYDLEAQRLKVNEDFLTREAGAVPGSINVQSWTRATNPVTYFAQMSLLSAQALTLAQQSLEDSVRTSTNPYFKIYLADVYVAQAVQPIVEQVLNSGSANLNDPRTLERLDAAIRLLQAVQRDSNGGLAPLNRFPPQNIFTPMDPYRIYTDRSRYYYDFWAGSLDQARHREVALTMLRNFIARGALPRIELPPAMAPRTISP